MSGDCVLFSDGGGAVTSALHPIHGAEKVVRFLIGAARGLTGGDGEFVDATEHPTLWFDSPAGTRLVTIERSGTLVTGVQIHGNPAKLSLIRTT